MKFTVRSIAALKPDHSREIFHWCDDVKGFGIRIKPTGTASYLLQYRTSGGISRRLTLGKVSVLTPDEARRLAKQRLSEVARGNDPANERAEERRSMSMKDLCNDYMKAIEAGAILGKKGLPKKPSTLVTDKGRIERHILPLLGTKKVRDITSPDIVRFIKDVTQGKTATDIKTGLRGRAIVEGGRGAAARTAGLLGGILTYAVTEGIIEHNPARGVKRPADQKRIVRLEPSHYRTLGESLPVMLQKGTARHAILAIQLLALTGCRRGEIEALQWSEVDLEGQALRLNDSKTGRSIRPIGKPVIKLLSSLNNNGTWVLPGREGRHYGGLPKVWARSVPIDGLTLHGLRHGFASVAGDLGYSELVIGALLGHASTGITSRYIHHIDTTLISAADAVASKIADMMGY